MAQKKSGVFVCSSHLSAYDPKDGAKVTAGPATQALANIRITSYNVCYTKLLRRFFQILA